jgi:hypothetical protein
MGDYVKKSMSSDGTRFRGLKVRACFIITRAAW